MAAPIAGAAMAVRKAALIKENGHALGGAAVPPSSFLWRLKGVERFNRHVTVSLGYNVQRVLAVGQVLGGNLAKIAQNRDLRSCVGAVCGGNIYPVISPWGIGSISECVCDCDARLR